MLSLCAITIVVLPYVALFSASCTKAWDYSSKDAVASSSISIFGLFTIALAIATLYL